MEELLQLVLSFLRGAWRFRWYGLVLAWAVTVVGSVVVWRLPDRYEASARIFVDTQSILRPLMAGMTVQPNVDQQLQMLSRTLISRPNIEKLIHMANLDLKNASAGEQEALIEQLSNKLAVKGMGRDNFYQLSYMDSNPEKAQRVIQSLVSIFVESSLGASRKDTNSAKLFLDEQIKAYRTKLEEAEARLKDFKLHNIEMQVAEGRDSAARIGAIALQLDQAKLELREAETARNAARAQLAGEKAGTGDASGTALQSLMQESAYVVATPEIDTRLELQRRRIDELMLRYTEEHPEVQATKRLIKNLEEQKRREVVELRRAAMAAPSMGSTGGTPAQQELSRVLANTEVQVASLQTRVAEYSARYAEAREAAKTAPQLEAEMAQLNRDYEIHRRNYQGLVERRELATISGQLEDAGVAEFRLIDPPRVPSKPSAPNRMLLMPLVFAGALAGGLVVALAISQVRPVFYHGNELRNKFGLPLLGVVSLMRSEAQERQERTSLKYFLSTFAGLAGYFLVVMGVLAVKTMK